MRFRKTYIPIQSVGKYITDRTLNDYLTKAVTDYSKDKLGFEQHTKTALDANCKNLIIEIYIGCIFSTHN